MSVNAGIKNLIQSSFTLNKYVINNSFKNLYKLFNINKYLIKKYLYTINHKRLGLNYFYFSLLTAASGALLATAIRIEMAYPGSPFFNGDSWRGIFRDNPWAALCITEWLGSVVDVRDWLRYTLAKYQSIKLVPTINLRQARSFWRFVVLNTQKYHVWESSPSPKRP